MLMFELFQEAKAGFLDNTSRIAACKLQALLEAVFIVSLCRCRRCRLQGFAIMMFLFYSGIRHEYGIVWPSGVLSKLTCQSSC